MSEEQIKAYAQRIARDVGRVVGLDAIERREAIIEAHLRTFHNELTKGPKP